MKKIRYSVDRREGALLVLIADTDGSVLKLDAEKYALSVSDVADVTFNGGEIASITPLPDEREARLKKNSDRLARLFGKKKN